MESTWERRDLPVLDAVVRHFDEHQDDASLPTAADFTEPAGLDVVQVHRAIRALSPTYLQAVQSLSEEPGDIAVSGVTDAARRSVGQWPSPEVWADRIIRELLDAADREPDEARRTKLRAAADALGGFGRDLLINVVANVAAKPIGV